MQPLKLPIPPLEQTLATFLTTVKPILPPSAWEEAQRDVADFAATDGPAAHEALLAFADEEHASGRSWLSNAWLSSYFSTRIPLPLASNVGFEFAWEHQDDPIDRAADIITRMAQVHLAQVRGETEPETTFRGAAVCMQQWRVLAGGIRHPQPHEDTYRPGRPGADDREIGVLLAGAYWSVPISDGHGRAFSAPTIAAVLRTILEQPRDSDDFTTMSYLGSEAAASALALVTADPAGAAVYERLTDALFVVNLIEEAADVTDHLARSTFARDQAWAYKPITYQISLADDFQALHVEHSIADGATIKAAIGRGQAATPDLSPAVDLTPTQLTWPEPTGLSTLLSLASGRYDAEAARYRVRLVTVPVRVPTGVSKDAVAQFSMAYAQWATYGTLRSTYEAVDMREYQAGRTECLRPNTAEAATLVRALADGTASSDLFLAAAAAHKNRVKACKTGNAIDRHLFGLRLMCGRLGLTPALFSGEAYVSLCSDLLSTTSIGDQEQLVRYTFAPTTPAGIGVNYTPTADGFEFLLSWHDDRCERPDEFVAALIEGAAALDRLMAD